MTFSLFSFPIQIEFLGIKDIRSFTLYFALGMIVFYSNSPKVFTDVPTLNSKFFNLLLVCHAVFITTILAKKALSFRLLGCGATILTIGARLAVANAVTRLIIARWIGINNLAIYAFSRMFQTRRRSFAIALNLGGFIR